MNYNEIKRKKLGEKREKNGKRKRCGIFSEHYVMRIFEADIFGGNG